MPPVAHLGIDAAIKATGLFLLAGRDSRMMTVNCSVGRDRLFFRAQEAIREITRGVSVARVVVEFHPFAMKGHSAVTHASVGFATGTWVAAAVSVLFPGEKTCPVESVAVGDIRERVLGMGNRGAKGKSWSRLAAGAYCTQHGLPSPSDDNQEEAWTCAEYARRASLAQKVAGGFSTKA